MKNKYRDAEIIELNKEEVLVVACDSCGGIGLKRGDFLKAPPFMVGKYTARVSLMEVLSLGAKAISFTANICSEPNPTGKEILRGIKSELKECALDIPITISTEKNMTTSMTALGTTVIGICKKTEILINQSNPQDFVYAVGIPKVGEEVEKDTGEIANAATLLKLLKIKNIKEIIPVGSLGIKGEINKFLKGKKLNMEYTKKISLNLEKTAGPGTVLLVMSEGELKYDLNIPKNFIGQLIKKP
ncbi:AIR synthase related protein [Crassaminicella profunda]|uniref:AIR synthase related protein n=1 Tax=Crassaminicella profunda TaxID=1286698 RepID=UPI001CA60927|nr:AIR synthase related protein [Crassaminicella profunda]QZY54792.1 hypothetical protein K7H06_17465 [Crassaminicella profunda]